MNSDLRAVYAWVKVSRERVFAWAEALPDGVYTLEGSEFAFGSLRNMQAHVAGCYRVWVGARGLGEDVTGPDPASVPDVTAMRRVFAEVDSMMERALGTFAAPDEPFDLILPGEVLRVTRRWLILHPVTHEFHHKGQMLTVGRVLGCPYPPGPDTDLGLPGEVPAG